VKIHESNPPLYNHSFRYVVLQCFHPLSNSEKGEDTFLFATNIDIRNTKDLSA
jgi:hypothetical protein